MNARLYDPEIGRFISPDTYIQAPTQSQNYNRYVYVMNNPLKYTDPSGHFFNFIIGAIIAIVASQSDNKYIQALGMAAGMALMGGAFGGSLFSSSIGNAVAAGFVQGYATTGTFKGALQNAFYSGLSAGIAGFIGHGGVFKGAISQGLAHGVAQGVISNLRGGSFKSGFVGGVIGKASGVATSGVGGTSGLAITLRTVTAAIFGGLASEATGGSFADGALSAALTHLFNDENALWWEDNYSLSQFGMHDGPAPFTETDAVFWEVMGASIPVGGGGAWVVGKLGGKVAFGNGNRAFWMGGIPSEAGMLARGMGYHTLEQTMAGKLSVQISKILPEQNKMKFWFYVSSRYARGTQSSVVPVFYNARTGVATGNVFRNSELPELISKGVSREYWAVW